MEIGRLPYTQDLTKKRFIMRKCIKCGEEKELEKFRKRQIWFSHTCKKCYSAQYASGKPNTGRFEKGHTPWIKGKKNPDKRKEPRYKKKGRPLLSDHYLSGKKAIWARNVRNRDGFKCLTCGSEKNTQAHHIVPWKECIEKRFDISNGKTLCSSCHMREERLLEISKGIRGKDGFTKIITD